MSLLNVTPRHPAYNDAALPPRVAALTSSIWSFREFWQFSPLSVPLLLRSVSTPTLRLRFPTIHLGKRQGKAGYRPRCVSKPAVSAPPDPTSTPARPSIPERRVEIWIYHSNPERFAHYDNRFSFTLGSAPIDPDPLGPVYRILAPISYIGIAKAAWAEPVFDHTLPLVVILFLPYDELETPEMLQQLVDLAAGSATLVNPGAQVSRP
ncbi:hypothetical protein BDW22DRAFT_965237 [Trametopsis cervina]|nr:hypothetical protein BDW22DRAFT_965237 [Trametopsis cervina]